MSATRTDRARLALIGCGFQGAYHARSASSSPHADLVVCCDSNIERAMSLSQANGVGEWSSDWKSVVARSDIDGVVIATTTHTHAEIAIGAAQAGKHILLEKPMATSVADCIRIEEEVARAGVMLMVGFKFRFAPAVRRARRAVPDPIVLTAHTLYDLEQVTAGWVNDRSLSGGRLMSSLVHSVDILRFLSGSEPVRVGAEGGALAVAGLSDPDNTVATVLFDNGTIASLVHGTAGKSGLLSVWSFQSAGRGVNATVFDHGRRLVLHDRSASEMAHFVDDVEDPFAAGMDQLVDRFARAVLDGDHPGPGPRDGTISVAVSRLIERAMLTGQTQQVEL